MPLYRFGGGRKLLLKDASSAAIYGSRAANGVIMITTKAGSASKEKMNVTFSMYGGWTPR